MSLTDILNRRGFSLVSSQNIDTVEREIIMVNDIGESIQVTYGANTYEIDAIIDNHTYMTIGVNYDKDIQTFGLAIKQLIKLLKSIEVSID